MAEFIRAKQSSFINKPIGVVSVDTGGIQAGKALADTGDRLANMYFKEATDLEQEKGRDYVANLSTRKIVKEYDMFDNEIGETSELNFQPIDTNLSAVAQSTAKPLMQRKYALALSNDLSKNLEQIRFDSKSSADFRENVNNFVPSYIEEINKLGGGNFTSQIQEGVAKLSTQHFFDMALKEKNDNILELANTQRTFTTSASQELNAVASNYANESNFTEFYNGLKEQKSDLLNSFNDSVDEYGSIGYTKSQVSNTRINIETTVARGLIRGFSKKLPAYKMESAELYLRNGTKITGKDGLSKEEFAFLDVVKQEAGQYIQVAIDEANGLAANLRTRESDIRTRKNEIRKETTNIETDLKNSQDTVNNKQNFETFASFTKPEEFAKDWVDTGEFDSNKFQDLNNLIKNSIGVKTKVKGFGFVNNSESDARIFQNRIIGYTATSLFRNSETINTAESVVKVTSKLANPNKNIEFTPKEKDFYNAMTELSKFHRGGPVTGSDIIIKQLNTIVNQSTKSATSKKAEISMNNTLSNFNAGKLENNITDRKNIDTHFKITNTTFQDGSYNPSESGPEGHQSYDKALMNKGAGSQSLITSLNALSKGTLPEKAALNVLSAYTRYANARSGYTSTPRNMLIPAGIDANVNGKLEMIADLYMDFKGSTSFFGTAGNGANGQITLTQIIDKVNAINVETDFSKTDLSKYGDKIKNEKDYLYKLGFKSTEVADLSAAAEIGLKLNIDPDKLKQTLTKIKDGVYHETGGFLVDPFYSSVLSKSKFAFTAVVPDDEKRMSVINLINSKLPANAMLNNTSFEITDNIRDISDVIEEEANIADDTFVGKQKSISKDFVVGQTSAETAMRRMTLRDSPSEEVARKTFRGKRTEDKVYLAPVKTSFARGDSQKTNMVYQAVELSEDGTFIPYIRNDRYFVFNVDTLLSELKTNDDRLESLDVMTKEEASGAKATVVLEDLN
jgi:hypothetical protein